MMTIAVRLFARARDLAGAERIELDLPDGADVARLRSALREQVPALGPLSSQLLVAVGNQYARDDTPLRPGDDIACFPPVSGG